jgi:hypothetical protein
MDLSLLLGWDPNEAIEDVANAALTTRRAAARSPDHAAQGVSPPEVRKPALVRFDGIPSRNVNESNSNLARGRLGPRGIGIAEGLRARSRSMPERGNDVVLLVDTLRRVHEALSEGIQVRVVWRSAGQKIAAPS